MSKKIQKIVATVLCIMMFAMPVYAAAAPETPNFRHFGTMYEGQWTKFKDKYTASFMTFGEGEGAFEMPSMFWGVANVLPASMLIKEGETYRFPLKDGKWEGTLHSDVKATFKASGKGLKLGKVRKLEDGTYEVPFTITAKKMGRSDNELKVTASYKKGAKVTDTIVFEDYGELRGSLGYLTTESAVAATCDTAGILTKNYYYKWAGDDDTQIMTVNTEEGTATLLNGDVIDLADRFAYSTEEDIPALGHDYQKVYSVNADGDVISYVEACSHEGCTSKIVDEEGNPVVTLVATKPDAVEKPEVVEAPEIPEGFDANEDDIIDEVAVPEGLEKDADGNVIAPAEPAGRPEVVEEPPVVVNPGEAPAVVAPPEGEDPGEGEEGHEAWVAANEAYTTYVQAKQAWDTANEAYIAYQTALEAYNDYVAAVALYEASDEYITYLALRGAYTTYTANATTYNNYIIAATAYNTFVTSAIAFNTYIDNAGVWNDAVDESGVGTVINLTGLEKFDPVPEPIATTVEAPAEPDERV